MPAFTKVNGLSSRTQQQSINYTFRHVARSKRLTPRTFWLFFANQVLDRLDMAGGDAATNPTAVSGRRRPQAPLNGDLSPRRAYQRQEIQTLLAEKAAREAELAARVQERDRLEALDRIPKPKPLTLPPHQARAWNPSPLL